MGQDQHRRELADGSRLLLLVGRHPRLQVAEQPMGRERRLGEQLQLQHGELSDIREVARAAVVDGRSRHERQSASRLRRGGAAVG